MRTYFLTIAAVAALGAALLAPGTAAAEAGPAIHASLTGQGVWGGGFAARAPVTVTVLAPDGSQLDSASASTDDSGYFELRQDELEIQLAPDMKVVVEVGSASRDVTLARLTFDLLDPGHDVATGTAPAGTDVVVYSWPGDTGVQLTTTAVAGDTWRADFGAQHLEVGGDGAAEVYEEDGDSTQASRSAPSVHAAYHYEFQRYDVDIGGSGWTPGAALDVEILPPGGGDPLWSRTFVASASEEGQEAGSFDHCCSSEIVPFDLVPGMQLEVTDTVSGAFAELTLEPFTIDRVDPVAGAVFGTAPPGAEVWLAVGDVRREAQAGTDGTWTVPGLALDWQSRVEAGTNDFDGDWTGESAQPATIAADLENDMITGTYFSLGGELRVDVLAADGTTAWWAPYETGNTRALVLHAGVDLVPGMEVEVRDEATGLVKALTLVPLTIDVVDPVADRARGTADTDLPLTMFAWWPGQGGGEMGHVVPAADGTWSFTFPAGSDVTPSTAVLLLAHDPEGDVAGTHYVAPVEAIPALEEEVPLLMTEELAKPLEEKLDGALASLGGSGGVTAAVATTAAGGSGGAVNVGAAINKLGAFVNQVQAYVSSRRIPPAAGARLSTAATKILVGLGG